MFKILTIFQSGILFLIKILIATLSAIVSSSLPSSIFVFPPMLIKLFPILFIDTVLLGDHTTYADEDYDD
jgi:hypothetical protein